MASVELDNCSFNVSGVRGAAQVLGLELLTFAADSVDESRCKNVATWVSVAMRRVIACSRSSSRTGVSERGSGHPRER